jgi:hypothetical protein
VKHNQAPVRHCRANTAVYSVGTSGRGRFRFQFKCTLSMKCCLDLASPLMHKNRLSTAAASLHTHTVPWQEPPVQILSKAWLGRRCSQALQRAELRRHVQALVYGYAAALTLAAACMGDMGNSSSNYQTHLLLAPLNVLLQWLATQPEYVRCGTAPLSLSPSSTLRFLCAIGWSGCVCPRPRNRC